jgi:hypothetical protein
MKLSTLTIPLLLAASSLFVHQTRKSIATPIINLSKTIQAESPSKSQQTFSMPPPDGIFINEIMASNNTIEDNTGSTSDWVEIFNNTNSTVNLKNYYLTDNPSNLQKFKFNSDLIISPRSYIVVWASGDESRGNNHVSWSLSASGETVVLTAPDGITTISSLPFPAQKTNVSYGRMYNNIDSLVFFTPASPAVQNIDSDAYLGFLNPPTFSQESGFYNAAFNLSISANPSESILYTLDASHPSADAIGGKVFNYAENYPESIGDNTWNMNTMSNTSFLYSNVINIHSGLLQNRYAKIATTYHDSPNYIIGDSSPLQKAAVVRAVATKAGYIPSSPVSRTYFLNSNFQSDFPIISLQVDPEKFWGFEDGINVPGKAFTDWKLANLDKDISDVGNYRSDNYLDANLTLFDNYQKKFDLLTRIRIRGGYTREFALKSMNVIIEDSEYDFFPYNFFEDNQNTDLESVILRNSGNDFWGSYFRDASIHRMTKNLNFETARYRPMHIFLNGEYWGILNARDRIDNDFLENKYGLVKEQLEIGDNEVIDNSSGNYEALVSYVKANNMSQTSHYTHFKNQVNIKSFIDFTIATCYFGNWDALTNNYKYWRSKESGKGDLGKWNWTLHDFDNAYVGVDFSTFNSSRGNDYFYKYVKSNAEFKNDFINRFADLINTHFKAELLTGVIDEMKSNLQPDISKQIARWKAPENMTTWNNTYTSIRSFAQGRNSVITDAIKTEFGLGGTYVLNVISSDTTKGFIKVNSIDINSSTPGIGANYANWSGTYFDNIPIRIVAKPVYGYKFSHWVHNGNTVLDSAIVINTSSNKSYQAYFEPDFASLVPQPFNVANCTYTFSSWESDAPAGSFPDNMKFVYFKNSDPTITDNNYEGATSGAYDHSSRTRINGLGELGVSFINTGGPAINEGFPFGKLGGAILAIKTTDVDSIFVNWTGRTITPNPRKYEIRLMYRIGWSGLFKDFDEIVKYNGATTADDSVVFTNIKLPEDALNQPYVQLLWKYQHLASSSGARDQLAIDDIEIRSMISGTASNNTTSLISNPSVIYSEENIINNSNVTYEANKAIILKPGFEVRPNSVFKASIKNCD